MTTATEPPLIDEPSIGVDEMPALEQPGERVCELFGYDMQACPQPAVWRLTFRELCACNDQERSLLLACGSCYGDVLAETQAAQCMFCGRYLPLLRAEPL